MIDRTQSLKKYFFPNYKKINERVIQLKSLSSKQQ